MGRPASELTMEKHFWKDDEKWKLRESFFSFTCSSMLWGEFLYWVTIGMLTTTISTHISLSLCSRVWNCFRIYCARSHRKSSKTLRSIEAWRHFLIAPRTKKLSFTFRDVFKDWKIIKNKRVGIQEAQTPLIFQFLINVRIELHDDDDGGEKKRPEKRKLKKQFKNIPNIFFFAFFFRLILISCWIKIKQDSRFST